MVRSVKATAEAASAAAEGTEESGVEGKDLPVAGKVASSAAEPSAVVATGASAG